MIDNCDPLKIIHAVDPGYAPTPESKAPRFTIYAAAPIVTLELPAPDQILCDFADRGDKLFIIGGSKTRKSFATLQLAMHVASGGMAGLPFGVPRPHRVLFLNLEIHGGHFRRRIQRMAKRLGLTNEIETLFVCDLRGQQIQPADIVDAARETRADVVIVDPAYKLAGWDEVDASQWLAGFDSIVEAAAALLIVVHHEKKGMAGDRQGVDRGSGDGRIQRDYDAALLLAPQRDEPSAIVLSQVQRNYAALDPCVLRFDCGAFVEAPDLAPIEATSRTSRAKVGAVAIGPDKVETIVRDHGPIGALPLREKLRQLGATRDQADTSMQEALASPGLDVYTHHERKAGGRKLFASKAQIQRLTAEAGE